MSFAEGASLFLRHESGENPLFLLKAYDSIAGVVMKRAALIITLVCLPFGMVNALTVGVFDIRGDVGNEGAKLADLAQSEIQAEKSLTLRDRTAVQTIKAQQEKCVMGQKVCPELSGMMKTLDLYVTGEAVSLSTQKQVILRAVHTGDSKIAAMAVGSGDTLEKSLEQAARDLRKKMATVKNADAGASGRWKLAVEPVRPANAQAQKLNELAGLDSMLLSALSKRAAFDLVETKSDDIVNAEVLLSQQGFAPGAFVPTGGAFTHVVKATIKVYDEARVLSYNVMSVQTGKSVMSDIIEWTANQNPNEALAAVAEKTEHDVQKVLGKLEIAGCDPGDAMLNFEYKDNARAPEAIQCKSPLLIEDIPAGEYTLVFKHEDRNTLSKTITIKPVEKLVLPKVQLPDIDMTLFKDASAAEASGKYAEANFLYSQFYSKYPRHRMASYAMYREGYVTQLRLKKVADGRKILENVISRKPDAEIRSEAYIGMALGYKAEGDADKANGIFRMLTDQYAGTTAAEFARECLEGKCSY